jgi:hypothetical protein
VLIVQDTLCNQVAITVSTPQPEPQQVPTHHSQCPNNHLHLQVPVDDRTLIVTALGPLPDGFKADHHSPGTNAAPSQAPVPCSSPTTNHPNTSPHPQTPTCRCPLITVLSYSKALMVAALPHPQGKLKTHQTHSPNPQVTLPPPPQTHTQSLHPIPRLHTNHEASAKTHLQVPIDDSLELFQSLDGCSTGASRPTEVPPDSKIEPQPLSNITGAPPLNRTADTHSHPPPPAPRRTPHPLPAGAH